MEGQAADPIATRVMGYGVQAEQLEGRVRAIPKRPEAKSKTRGGRRRETREISEAGCPRSVRDSAPGLHNHPAQQQQTGSRQRARTRLKSKHRARGGGEGERDVRYGRRCDAVTAAVLLYDSRWLLGSLSARRPSHALELVPGLPGSPEACSQVEHDRRLAPEVRTWRSGRVEGR